MAEWFENDGDDGNFDYAKVYGGENYVETYNNPSIKQTCKACGNQTYPIHPSEMYEGSVADSWHNYYKLFHKDDCSWKAKIEEHFAEEIAEACQQYASEEDIYKPTPEFVEETKTKEQIVQEKIKQQEIDSKFNSKFYKTDKVPTWQDLRDWVVALENNENHPDMIAFLKKDFIKFNQLYTCKQLSFSKDFSKLSINDRKDKLLDLLGNDSYNYYNKHYKLVYKFSEQCEKACHKLDVFQSDKYDLLTDFFRELSNHKKSLDERESYIAFDNGELVTNCHIDFSEEDNKSTNNSVQSPTLDNHKNDYLTAMKQEMAEMLKLKQNRKQ